MGGKPLYDGLWERVLSGKVFSYGQVFHCELVLLEHAPILIDEKVVHDVLLWGLVSHDETPWEHALMNERPFRDDSLKNVRAFHLRQPLMSGKAFHDGQA